ncbi:hypothetical protein N7488_007129 [Penicillium malachiteum]|nr:hypothetical protein N7488_007129 [Penicillium malachiteum]
MVFMLDDASSPPTRYRAVRTIHSMSLTVLEGLINYYPSCADDVTPEIEKLEKVEKEAVAAYGFSVSE